MVHRFKCRRRLYDSGVNLRNTRKTDVYFTFFKYRIPKEIKSFVIMNPNSDAHVNIA